MSDIGREMRPMLNGTWKVPACQGRRSFRLRGFIIGLVLGIGLLTPAAMLVIQNRSAFADTVSGREPIPAPPRTTLAVVSAPGPGRTEARNEAPRRQNDTPAKGPVREIPPADASSAPAAAPEAPSPASPRIIRLKMRVTAYCPCRRCCGKFADGKTASGKPIWTNGARFVAAPKWVPFGAKIRVPGYHEAVAVPVLDRGGQIYGHRLDVFFLSHHVAKEWAVQYLDVEIEMPR